MEILYNFYGVSMIFYGVSKGVSMVVLWDSYEVSKGVSMGFPLDSCGGSVVPLPVVPHKAVAEVSKIGSL